MIMLTKLLYPYFYNPQVEDLTENLRHAALVSASAAELEVSSCVAQLTDPSQLDSCLAQLREVLGPLVPEETLVQVGPVLYTVLLLVNIMLLLVNTLL